MLIKEADSRQSDLDELNALLALPHVNADTKQQIRQEIRNIQSGIKGETDAAFQINFHYENSPRWAVIHDLRLEFEGHAAQIDHLLINRFLEIYVCESKRFAEGIGFNEHGEFYRYSQGKPYAIESPIEQNNRHILLLQRLFNSGEINLPTRLGFRMKPSLHSLILIANTSAIRRPKNSKKVDGMDRIIKVEQLVKRRDQDLKEENFLHTFSSVNKLISTETLQNFAENLADLHTPAKKDWKARFGIPDMPSEQTPPPANIPKKQPAPPAAMAETAKPMRLFCADCKKTVSQNVADFCWNNKVRFHGRVYCFDCQRKYKAGS